MRINKVICLEPHIHERLEGINASQLINELLEEHFNIKSEKDKYANMTMDELDALEVIEIKRQELLKELEALPDA